MTWETLTEVWTPLSALFAIIAGVAIGVGIGWFATNPQYSTGTATPRRLSTLIAFTGMSAGLAFFALQTLGTYLSHDPQWPRVMSRYGQWVVFSVAIGVTTWYLIRRDRDRRHARARANVANDRDQANPWEHGA